MTDLLVQYAPLLAALVAAGIVAGLAAGLFGIGGGARSSLPRRWRP